MTVLVAMLFVSAAALRGYLPGVEPPPREVSADSPLATVAVVGLLGAAVAVIGLAVIARLRKPAPPVGVSPARPDWLRTERGKPTWRMAVVAFGLILGWLLVTMLLGRLGGPAGGTAIVPGAPPPTATATPAGPARAAPQPPADPNSHLLFYFSLATAAFLLILVVGAVAAARRQRRPRDLVALPHVGEDAEREADAGSESLARAAEVALAEVGDLSREPRKAIIACYAAMERELSLRPDAAPRDFDTASEVLARAVDLHALGPDSATQLVDLFDEARFSPHVMNEGHRDAAVAVLTQVLGELRSHA